MVTSPTRRRVETLALNLAVAIGGIIVVLPMLWMVTASFKPLSEIYTYPHALPAPVQRLAVLELVSQQYFHILFADAAGAVLHLTGGVRLRQISVYGQPRTVYDFARIDDGAIPVDFDPAVHSDESVW